MSSTVVVPRPPGFSLAAHQAFYGGFLPGSGMAAASLQELAFVFLADQTFEPLGVTVSESGEQLRLTISGDPARARHQVGRMLGWDADADAWGALGRQDPVVGRLQASFPGFFTAAFPSPYEAGVGGVLAQRMSMEQAAALRLRLARAHGGAVPIGGATRWTLPAPAAMLAIESFPGLPVAKLGALHALARAAVSGQLDAERLRQLPAAFALQELERLPGIGPWTAGHVYVRGAAPADALPSTEPRFLRAVAHLDGGPVPVDRAELERRTDSWRPFRTWVAILATRELARSGAWAAAPSDRRGRAWPVQRSPPEQLQAYPPK